MGQTCPTQSPHALTTRHPPTHPLPLPTCAQTSQPTPTPPLQDGAPFSGSYRPTQRLQFLVEGNNTLAGLGGSQGVWVLRFDDLAPNATRLVGVSWAWEGVGA